MPMKTKTVASWLRELPLAIGIVSLLTLSACSRIHEPWVVNAKQWKEEQFKMNVPDSELRTRIMTTQSDR